MRLNTIKTRALFATLVFTMFANVVHAAVRFVSFQHLGVSAGLPDDSVLGLTQDNQGLIWIATDSGLARFDGNTITTYVHSSKKDSLPVNWIWRLAKGPQGDIWLATAGGGLVRWNRASNTFTDFRHVFSNTNSVVSNNLTAIATSSKGLIAVGSESNGLSVFYPKTGRFTRFNINATRQNALYDNTIGALLFDKRGNLWVGTGNGLAELEKDSDKFRKFLFEAKPGQGSAIKVVSLAEDKTGDILAGTLDQGLFVLDSAGRVIKNYRHKKNRPQSLGSNAVFSLLCDHRGRIWVGTDNGLELMGSNGKGFIKYTGRPYAADGLSKNAKINAIFQSGDGIIWIGTTNSGLYRFNPNERVFGKNTPRALSNKTVTAFAKDGASRVWVGSDRGLYTFNLRTKQLRLAHVSKRALSLKNRYIVSLLSTRSGLWVGTLKNGLVYLSKDGKSEDIGISRTSPMGLNAQGVLSLLRMPNGMLWLGTYGGGINILNPATGVVKKLPFKGSPSAGQVSNPLVSVLTRDAAGRIWVGTYGGGLDLANDEGKILKVFKTKPGDKNALPSNMVYAIFVDRLKHIWVGTSNGLSEIKKAGRGTGKLYFSTISGPPELKNKSVYGIVQTGRNTLWISTSAGLVKFNVRQNTFKAYRAENGLIGGGFGFGASLKLARNYVIFGGKHGFNLFNTRAIHISGAKPSVVLTKIEVSGIDDKSVPAPWNAGKIRLKYSDNIVSFTFAVTSYVSPDNNLLEYKVSGLTNHWIKIDHARQVTLTNLQSGSHTLEVSGANANLIWSKPLKLRIYKAPPPWKSTDAYIFYALTLIGLFAFLLKRQKDLRKKQEKDTARLEKMVETRTHELTCVNEQLVTMAKVKSDFLDRMSHELRTPINGVVGMAELLGRTKLTAEQTRLTKTIRSSGEVLLQLVNDLLDFSKAKAGKIKLEAIPVNIKHLVEECADLFTITAEDKGLALKITPPNDIDAMLAGKTLQGDPLRVRQILLNLISNAIKFTETGTVEIGTRIALESADRATVELVVKDSGIGMDMQTVGRIFDPFTQADESTSRRFGGSGLGLAICRELADLMGGKITVESAPGKGSTFRVSLTMDVQEPAGREETKTAATENSGTFAGIKVLIVEDEPVNAAVAEGYLETIGCLSSWVENAQDAIKAAQSNTFDIILMDINMPGQDGFETSRVIREFDAKTPIIALTAHNEALVRARCLSAGMNDVLSKPYTLEACVNVIKMWATPRVMLTSNPEQFEQKLPISDETEGDSPNFGERQQEIKALSALNVDSVGHLRKSRASAPPLYVKLSVLYAEGSKRSMSELGAALDRGDLKTAADLCHKLKSSTASIGAIAFAEKLKLLEQLCLNNEAAKASEVYSLLALAHPAVLFCVAALSTQALP